jgi:hypothetical protein
VWTVLRGPALRILIGRALDVSGELRWFDRGGG